MQHARCTLPATLRPVLSNQRICAEMVDMVGYNHNVADFERGVHAARSIAYYQQTDSKSLEHSDRKRNLLHRIALVKMKPALHGNHFFSGQISENQLPFVSLNRRNGEIGNFTITNRFIDFNFVGEIA